MTRPFVHFVGHLIGPLFQCMLSVRVPGCQKYKWLLNPVWHRMLYSCTHMASAGDKGLLFSIFFAFCPRVHAVNVGGVTSKAISRWKTVGEIDNIVVLHADESSMSSAVADGYWWASYKLIAGWAVRSSRASGRLRLLRITKNNRWQRYSNQHSKAVQELSLERAQIFPSSFSLLFSPRSFPSIQFIPHVYWLAPKCSENVTFSLHSRRWGV